jgi:hypothetical protein
MIYLLTLYDVLLLTENTEHCSNGKEVDLSCPEGYMILSVKMYYDILCLFTFLSYNTSLSV